MYSLNNTYTAQAFVSFDQIRKTQHHERLTTIAASPAVTGKCAWRLLAQAVQAAQITFEDYFLSSMDVPALKIVGFEGLWGAGVMLLILLPIVQLLPGKDGSGLHEDSLDTLHVRHPSHDHPSSMASVRINYAVTRPRP